jgi:hypothetical protein
MLSNVFEWAVKSASVKQVQTAVKLSQVCQTWRQVALKARRIWRYIDMGFKRDFSVTKSILQTAFSHLSSLPPEICLKGIGQPSKNPRRSLPKFISILNLNRFMSIDSIRVELAGASDLEQLATAVFGYSAGTLKALSVKPKAVTDGEPPRDVGCLRKNFPTVESLTLYELGSIYLGGSEEFASLHTLELRSSFFPTLPSQLSRFKNLATLKISGKFVMEEIMDKIVMSNLVKLDINEVTGFPWSTIDAPQLTRVIATGRPESAIDFFCRHQTIRNLILTVWVSEISFKKLAAALPALESLGLGGAVNGFFAASGVISDSPLFPNLSRLVLDLRFIGNVSLESFERFLYPRRVPSQVKEEGRGVQKLRQLQMSNYTTRLDEAEWINSTLLDTCKRTRTEDGDRCTLELRWVE